MQEGCIESYMAMRIKPNTKFGKWLFKKFTSNDLAVHDFADDIHSSPKTIYNHLLGKVRPTFIYVVTYCWYFQEYFADGDDPYEIWGLVEEDWGEEKK